MNMWRHIPAGDHSPDLVNAGVEVISGSRDKYEYRIGWEAFALDRLLHLSTVFQLSTVSFHKHGLMTMTLWTSLSSYEPLEVGCLVKARTIQALMMEDEEGEDPKILSVPVTDPRFDGFNDLSSVHHHKLREIQESFEVYKRLEQKKWVKFKAWRSAEEVKGIVNHTIYLHQRKMAGGR